MENFEDKLKGLAHREPSESLDERVMQALSRRPAREASSRGRVVSLRWALAACFLVGVMSFLAGRVVPPTAGHESARIAASNAAPPAVTVNVIYDGPAANPFDMTTAADDGLKPTSSIKFSSNTGV